ncbi:MAG TPA: hypothetical protein DCE23_08900, partial [Firmicutes bacterium]|nr:hypothetical protein [Bacillota bacterium]
MKYKNYLLLTFYLFLAAINFNFFLRPHHLVTGGTQGLAILLENFIPAKPYLIVFIINIIALIISYFFLSINKTKSALIATFIYPLLIKLTSIIPNINIENIFLSSIIAGIICGISGGLIYKTGFSSGGITIFNWLINKYLNIKLSYSNFIINTIIILIGSYIYG